MKAKKNRRKPSRIDLPVLKASPRLEPPQVTNDPEYLHVRASCESPERPLAISQTTHPERRLQIQTEAGQDSPQKTTACPDSRPFGRVARVIVGQVYWR